MKSKKKVRITCFSPKYLDEILEIEKSSFENLWQKEDFQIFSQKKNHKIMVATIKRKVVGFIAFQKKVSKNYLIVLNLVVAKDFQRHGVAQRLFNLPIHYSMMDGTRLICTVRESNLPVQCFLRKIGFCCHAIAKSYFVDHFQNGIKIENGYCFNYLHRRIAFKNKPVKIIDYSNSVLRRNLS